MQRLYKTSPDLPCSAAQGAGKVDVCIVVYHRPPPSYASASLCICLAPPPQGADEGKSAKQEKDELIMALLLEEVLPKATSLYLAGPLQVRGRQHRALSFWGSRALHERLPFVYSRPSSTIPQ
jgi:hypothetical protein